MNKLFALLVLVGIVASTAPAATVTNLGQVITVTKLSETSDAGTTVADQSVYATPTSRKGLIVAQCKITSSTASSLDFGYEVPQGAILGEEAVIEVETAVLPATSTNSIAVGGVTVLATGVTLGSTGIKQAVSTPGITTAADKLTLTVTGSAATSGVFTVYIPYILGNAIR